MAYRTKIDPEVVRTRALLSVALRRLDPDKAAQAARELVLAKRADLDRRFAANNTTSAE